MAKQFLYFADPMCSWCWGFSPVMEALAEHVGDRAPVHVLMGGLYLGVTEPMDTERKTQVRHHWERVREASGQPFDFGFFDRPAFIYDTEKACRALVTARRINPPAALPFLRRLHRAFYAENRDLTRPDVLFAVAEEAGFDPERFEEAFDEPETLETTAWDFNTARKLGATAYPTLLAHEDDKAAAITIGFQPWAQLEPVVTAWLEGQAAIQ